MEQFDSFNPVRIEAILTKIENIGFTSPSKEITLIDNIIQVSDTLLSNYIASKQQSVICFFIEDYFLKSQSKRKTYEYFNSYLNSLEQYNTKQSSIILYLFQVDQCMHQANVYKKCNEIIRDVTKVKKDKLLDHVTLKFNDIINISQLVFEDITVDEILKLLSQEVQQHNQKINPLQEQVYEIISRITASHLIQLMIIHFQSKIQILPFQTPKKRRATEEQQNPRLQGFYKWDSPLFSQTDFFKNPLNQRLLDDLDRQAKQYPKTRLLNSQFNYYSPLPINQTRSDFESKDSVFSDLIKLRSIDMSKSPSKGFGYQNTQSTKKYSKIKQNGCMYAEEIPRNQPELSKIVQKYQIEYFDPILKLPPPLDKHITYESLIDLFSELEQEITFTPQHYKGLQYFSSYDPRYLQISQNEKIIAISQIDGWILGKNEFGHIGCCAETYIYRL